VFVQFILEGRFLAFLDLPYSTCLADCLGNYYNESFIEMGRIIFDFEFASSWKKLKDYGQRRIAEIIFSPFKRVLGESLRSRKFLCQKAEASFKVMLYNKFLSA
jgi:hypothetical protein